MYNMYVFKKKCISVCINPLSRIHNISLKSAYFGLDSRECKYLEYIRDASATPSEIKRDQYVYITMDQSIWSIEKFFELSMSHCESELQLIAWEYQLRHCMKSLLVY
jgi:hypothetical protein